MSAGARVSQVVHAERILRGCAAPLHTGTSHRGVPFRLGRHCDSGVRLVAPASASDQTHTAVGARGAGHTQGPRPQFTAVVAGQTRTIPGSERHCHGSSRRGGPLSLTCCSPAPPAPFTGRSTWRPVHVPYRRSVAEHGIGGEGEGWGQATRAHPDFARTDTPASIPSLHTRACSAPSAAPESAEQTVPTLHVHGA